MTRNRLSPPRRREDIGGMYTVPSFRAASPEMAHRIPPFADYSLHPIRLPSKEPSRTPIRQHKNWSMRNMTVCVTACLTVLAGLAAMLSPLRTNAREAGSSTKLGDILFGVNRPLLDAQVQQQQAQNALIQAEIAEAETNIALAQQEARLRALVQARRRWLAEAWVDMGIRRWTQSTGPPRGARAYPTRP